MFAPGLLAGKRILVTGGGTGLGRSAATRFASLGAEIFICGRRQAVLDTAAAEIAAATGARVHALACDVRDAQAVDAMMQRIWDEGGPLSALMNNAAGNFISRTEALSPRAFDAVLSVVLHGTAYGTLAAGRRWIADGVPGAVLSVVTTAAWTGGPFTAPSATAKAGVLALMRSLASEWGPKGIRLNAIAPGLFPTPGAWDRLYPPEVRMEPQENNVPLRRVGQHQEFADLCAYLLSDGAGYINGEVVTIDGGRWMGGAGGSMVRPLYDWGDEEWRKYRAFTAQATTGKAQGDG